MATIAELEAEAVQIRDEVLPGANSANRLGSTFLMTSNILQRNGAADNVIKIPVNNVLVPRNDAIDFCTIDFRNSPVNTRGGAMFYRWEALVSYPPESDSNNYSIQYVTRAWQYRMQKSGALGQGTNVYSFIPTPLSSDIAAYELDEISISPAISSDGLWTFSLENTTVGLTGTHVLFNGVITFIYSGILIPPIVTVLI